MKAARESQFIEVIGTKKLTNAMVLFISIMTVDTF